MPGRGRVYHLLGHRASIQTQSDVPYVIPAHAQMMDIKSTRSPGYTPLDFRHKIDESGVYLLLFSNCGRAL